MIKTNYIELDNKIMIMNGSRKNLGKILKQQRQSLNLTLYELAATSKVSPSYLGRIENGERFPSAEILKRIAHPLGFSEEELFALAGYLSNKEPSEDAPSVYQLDPYVERILSQEPVEIQRAALGILSILKSLSSGQNLAKTAPSENRPSSD
jgi:transcriptional regulator with XRE-family HTH domain